jgi:predicted RNA-binding protein with RPS1 domain
VGENMSKPSSRKELVGEVPKIYSIFKGEVVSVQPYGVFIKIPGCSKNGLVHRSQMSSTVIDKPDEMLSVGEKVFCKVLSAEPDGTKIALSMKIVNQTTGKDLDPANVQANLDEKRKKSPWMRDVAPIALDAVFDTTCKKCGGKGHLAQDCFHRPGDKSYELLIDDVDVVAATGTITGENVKEMHEQHQCTKKKKHKKKKSRTDEATTHKKHKKKKSKSHRRDSSPVQPTTSRCHDKRKSSLPVSSGSSASDTTDSEESGHHVARRIVQKDVSALGTSSRHCHDNRNVPSSFTGGHHHPSSQCSSNRSESGNQHAEVIHHKVAVVPSRSRDNEFDAQHHGDHLLSKVDKDRVKSHRLPRFRSRSPVDSHVDRHSHSAGKTRCSSGMKQVSRECSRSRSPRRNRSTSSWGSQGMADLGKL